MENHFLHTHTKKSSHRTCVIPVDPPHSNCHIPVTNLSNTEFKTYFFSAVNNCGSTRECKALSMCSICIMSNQNYVPFTLLNQDCFCSLFWVILLPSYMPLYNYLFCFYLGRIHLATYVFWSHHQ